MTAALPPDLAIAYVTELSADVKAAVVLDAEGAVLAGDASLRDAARAARTALGSGAAAAAHTPHGIVTAAATPAHTLLVLSAESAFPGPTLIDTRVAAAALAGDAPETVSEAPGNALKTAVEREISEITRPFA
jgi:hypothetical protein